MEDSETQTPALPRELIREIREGRCVAFVGAGFSAAASLPLWPELLKRAAESLSDGALREHISLRLSQGSSDGNEEVAQLLERQLGRKKLIEELKKQLDCANLEGLMDKRLDYLYGIPFRAVLTTNFDTILKGDVAGAGAFKRVLNAPRSVRSLVEHALSGNRLATAAPVVKLHGDISEPDSVVLSRVDYRRRLYGDTAYLGFLRSLLLNNVVLYMGFSFTDAYINQLRLETLELLGQTPEDRPRSYALINDLPPFTQRHLLETEGIEVLPFDTAGGTDFSGFDRTLERLHRETDPLISFGRMMAGKRILWVDRDPASVALVTHKVIPEAIAAYDSASSWMIDFARDYDDAKRQLAPGKYDLIVSRWGHTPDGDPLALQILSYIRKNEEIDAPLIVFATEEHADENKRRLLSRGGVGYYHSWEGVLRGFEHVFSSGRDTG